MAPGHLREQAREQRRQPAAERIEETGPLADPSLELHTTVNGTDTVVAVSGSGTTGGTVRVAEQASALGAAIWAVTTDPASPLGSTASGLLLIPAATKYRRADEAPTIQPLSSLFDQATHIALDVVCLQIAGARGVDNALAARAHANTE